MRYILCVLSVMMLGGAADAKKPQVIEPLVLKEEENIDAAMELQKEWDLFSLTIAKCIRDVENSLIECHCDNAPMMRSFAKTYYSVMESHPHWQQRTLKIRHDDNHVTVVFMDVLKHQIDMFGTLPCEDR